MVKLIYLFMKRKDFLQTLGVLALSSTTMELKAFLNQTSGLSNNETMPALFIGHGSPMNAIQDNNFTRKLSEIGNNLPKPVAILVVSAHWLTKGTYVSMTANPETIYDFGGFPEELFRIKYPAIGAPDLAQSIAKDINAKGSAKIHEDNQMGLDHGTWTVLKHMYPKADIPVFQLSIDYQAQMEYHYNLATYLQYLREKGILVISSGNIVHNLQALKWQEKHATPYDWAIEFDEFVKINIDINNHIDLINYKKINKISNLAHPSNDHYLPLLYSLGIKKANDTVTHLFEGIEMGSISMRCFMVN